MKRFGVLHSGEQREDRLAAAALLVAVLAVSCLWGGCQTPGRHAITRPTKHSIRHGPMLVLSDFRLQKEHPLIQDLILLREQVTNVLQLPPQNRDVIVYIFNNQLEYQQFLDSTYPGLPSRRAYFVGTPKELAVYTFWGDRIQEDLRHEYTHGLLHSSLKAVPLWIDEGLAEYFEVPGPIPGTINPDYAERIAASLANGWRPDMKRLERLEEFSQMQRVDYQEAWAWVHFMLHSSPESKEILLSYLSDLRENRRPKELTARFQEQYPQYGDRFLGYLVALNTMKLLPHEIAESSAGGVSNGVLGGLENETTGRVRLASGNVNGQSPPFSPGAEASAGTGAGSEPGSEKPGFWESLVPEWLLGR